MIALLILIISIFLQFLAAFVALNLIRKTGRKVAWVFISAALFLMGVRRTVSLVRSLFSENIIVDPVAESVALLISILMVVGVWMIGKVFDHLDRLRVNAEEELEKREKAEERKEFLNTLLRQDLASRHQVLEGYIQLLEEMDLSGEQEGYLKKAIKAEEEADDILGLAEKLEEIENTEWVGEKDIIKVLDDVMEDISDLVDREGVKIEKGYSEEVVMVEGNYSLNTLFSEILKTRILTSEVDKVRVGLEEEEDTVVVRIEDDGKPLPKDCENLVSGESYTGETTGAKGVRYYMFREIVRHNDDEIMVKDSELGGARFEISINKI